MTRISHGSLTASPSAPADVPPHACDGHARTFGPFERYALADDRSYTPPKNPPARFIEHLDALGFKRAVVGTASVYGMDSAALADALQRYPIHCRGQIQMSGCGLFTDVVVLKPSLKVESHVALKDRA